MNSMFRSATSFNGDISKWDLSSVTDMSQMFDSAPLFNSDISKWDVSSVTDMSQMFSFAESFNVDLSNWDVSSVTHIDKMFYKASSFAQTLCGKWLTSKAIKQDIFVGSSGEICTSESATSFTTTLTTTKWTPDSNEDLR